MNKFRYPGEYEKQDAVWLNYFPYKYSCEGYDVHKVYAEVVKNLLDEVKVYINCGIPSLLEECKKSLMENNVDISKINFTQFNDYLNWARDYGPNILIDDIGNFIAVNQNFNTYGQRDEDCEISILARRTGIHQAIEMGVYNIINSEMVSEGGDKEFNGNGTLMTILDTEVRKRNPKYTKEEIEKEYKKRLNSSYLLMLFLSMYCIIDTLNNVGSKIYW